MAQRIATSCEAARAGCALTRGPSAVQALSACRIRSHCPSPLAQVWYPTTVATQAREFRKTIQAYSVLSQRVSQVDFLPGERDFTPLSPLLLSPSPPLPSPSPPLSSPPLPLRDMDSSIHRQLIGSPSN